MHMMFVLLNVRIYTIYMHCLGHILQMVNSVCTSLVRRHFAGRRKHLETLCRKTLENGMFTSRVIANT